MDVILYIYFFTAGLVLGSFYNVAGMRLPAGKSVLVPRSHCPRCRHVLGAGELIPVLSYVLLKGKCSSCRAGISPVYPLFELMTGFLFAGSWHFFGWTWELLAALLFMSLLHIITVSDLEAKIIPDRVLLLFFIPLFFLRLTEAPLAPWWDALLGGAGGFLLLFGAAVLSKGGVGGGDIKLYGVVGVVLGLQGMFLSLFFAAAAGLLTAAPWILYKGLGKSTEIPFGPFIAAGAAVVYFTGPALMDIYAEIVAVIISFVLA